MTIITQLFTERFRPKTLESLIAPPRIKSQLSKGLILNQLFYGSPGTGKCVDENTIITIKNKITGEVKDISFKEFMVLLEKEK